ncbi:hypothetical protein BJ165DRAFT_1406058 [Panaeolus papilionaceus]|nr:hypothetical protein BJ165DRAFT_1406058 [Panaeolus papilionaceus]
MHQYIIFKVHGNVSVEPEEPQFHPGDLWVPPKFICVLVMGPTGAGKSSAFCGYGSLGISKNQLEGYTQCISAYKTLNADFLTYGQNESSPIYLIDTPGFCDSTMSDMEIIKMLKEWMSSHGIAYFHHILYLLPITDIRLSGKKKRTIEMFQSIVGGPSWQLTIVTTMWDRVWNQQGKERAVSNLEQLGRDVWKNYRGKDRIDAARQQTESLEFDLAQPDTQAHQELRVILKTRLNNAQQYLLRMEGQLRELHGEHEAKPDEPEIANGFGPSAIFDRLKGWFHSWL